MPEETFFQHARAIYTRYFAYWAWLVVASILGVGFFVVMYPLWLDIQATGVFQYSQLVTTQAARQTELDQLKLMSDRLQQLNRSQLLYVEDALPATLKPAELMEQVSNTFLSEGLLVTSIDVVQSETAGTSESTDSEVTDLDLPGVQEIQLTINITGDTSYEGLKSFLDTIHESNPILELSSIAFSNERQSFSVVLTTYVAN